MVSEPALHFPTRLRVLQTKAGGGGVGGGSSCYELEGESLPSPSERAGWGPEGPPSTPVQAGPPCPSSTRIPCPAQGYKHLSAFTAWSGNPQPASSLQHLPGSQPGLPAGAQVSGWPSPCPTVTPPTPPPAPTPSAEKRHHKLGRAHGGDGGIEGEDSSQHSCI